MKIEQIIHKGSKIYQELFEKNKYIYLENPISISFYAIVVFNSIKFIPVSCGILGQVIPQTVV